MHHRIGKIRPGNYVFLDRTPVRMGLFSVQDVALSVLVTVVSSNKYYFIVDAGSKVFSSDAYVAKQFCVALSLSLSI